MSRPCSTSTACGSTFAAGLRSSTRSCATSSGSSRADGAPADITVELEHGAPRWDGYGDLTAAFVTPRNVVYQNGSRTILDYFGRASAELDRARGPAS